MSSKTLYFYKGTAFPIWVSSKPKGKAPTEEFRKLAMEMILLGLRQGISREMQIVDYKTQLDVMEQGFYKVCNPTSVEGLKRMVQRFGMSEDELYSMWVLNILALMIMGALKEDNDNGLLTTTC
jgi:hypothetical protein